MTLFMVSLTGIPPTVGFWGKFYLFTAVVDAGLTWLAIVAVLMSAVLGLLLPARRLVHVLPRGARGAPQLEPEGASMGATAAIALAGLGVVVFGLYPAPLIQAAQGALRVLLTG